MKRTDVYHLHPHQISVKEGFNVREDYGNLVELKNSIIENGVKKPISVYKLRGEDEYVIIEGHRRFAAVQMAMEEGHMDITIPAIKEPSNLSNAELIQLMLVMNDGKPLSMLEQSKAFSRLREEGWSATDISKHVGKSITHVGDCLLLADAGEALHTKVREGLVSASLVITQLKNSGSDAVNDQIEVALNQQKSGKKKVSKKHLATAKDTTVTVDDIKALYEMVDDQEAARSIVLDVDKMDVFHNIVRFYDKKMSFEELVAFFTDKED